MVYITKHNLKRITRKINTRKELSGDVYKRLIAFFSKKEKSHLLAIKQLCIDPKVFIEQYFRKVVNPSNENLIKPHSQPAYHKDSSCTTLNSDYVNYVLPDSIKQESDETIQKFRDWFLKHEHLLLEGKGDVLAYRCKMRFGFDFNPEQVLKMNTGVDVHHNLSLAEIESLIDQLLDELESLQVKDKKARFIIQKFGSLTFLADSNKEIYSNKSGYSDKEIREYLKEFRDEFKTPITEHLIDWYRMKYNPDFEFERKLLDDLGFKKCSLCYSKETNKITSSNAKQSHSQVNTDMHDWWRELEDGWKELLKENYLLNFDKSFIEPSIKTLTEIQMMEVLSVDGSMHSINSLQPVYNFHNAKFLSIHFPEEWFLENMEDLNFLEAIPNIELLNLVYCQLVDLEKIKDFQNIKAISLQGCYVKDLKHSLLELKNISYVNFNKSGIDTSDDKKYVSKILGFDELNRICLCDTNLQRAYNGNRKSTFEDEFPHLSHASEDCCSTISESFDIVRIARSL